MIHSADDTRLPENRWRKPLLCGLSLLIAAIGGGCLLRGTPFEQLTATFVSFGLDPLRSQLVASVAMTMGAALAGALLGGSVSGAVMGSNIIFCYYYVYNFILTELRPVYDPGGHLEALDRGTLVHTVMIMLAIALLGAFLSAASGSAVREVLLDPPSQLIRLIRSSSSAQRSVIMPQPMNHRHVSTTRVALQAMIGWMKALLLVGLVFLAAQSVPLFLYSPDTGIHQPPKIIIIGHTQSDDRGNQQGSLLQDSLTSSALNLQHRSIMVYVPPSYNTTAGREKRYPVLYLLHGFPGGERDWFTAGKAAESADTLIASGQIPEVILVAPDGNGRGGVSSEWGNSYDHRQLMETFVATDLVTYVDQHYRTIPDAAHRAIGGLSMGGFGAMNIALHHPDVFGTVISLGGYYRAEGAIWGTDPAYRQQNSPVTVLPQEPRARNLHIYVGAASQDQPYYNDAKQFLQELASLHIAYQFDLQQGYHSWRVWQVQMYHALLWIKWG
jgi:enterochelin esterase-like enzyme